MNVRFEGELEIRAPIRHVFSFLSDTSSMVKCIPDLESVDSLDENSFKIRVKIGISFLKGTIAVNGSIVEKEPYNYAKLLASAGGLGSNVTLETSFKLIELEERMTKMSWVANANLQGLIGGLGSRLIKAFGEKKIEELLNNIKKELES